MVGGCVWAKRKNRAGKAALSRTKASGKAAERSEVLSLLAVVRGASRQRVERGWLTEIARNGAKRNEGADSLRWKRRVGVRFCCEVEFFGGRASAGMNGAKRVEVRGTLSEMNDCSCYGFI